MGIVATARVSARLAAMATATTWTVQRMRWQERRSGCPHAAVAAGHAWAKRMLPALGVELEVLGTPPRERTMLLANHRSYLDIPVLLSQLPCAFLAKAEIAGWPIFGSAARLSQAVFVKREDKASRRAARRSAVERLQRGLSLAAFPEGTTSRGPGLLPFFPGLFEEAEAHGFPVMPVAIALEDPGDAWVDDDPFLDHFLRSFRKRRVRVAVAFGPLLRPGRARDLKGETEHWIRARLAGLQGPAPARTGGAERTLPGRAQPSAA